MYFTGTCPEWFWLIPLIGMLLMIGIMFFMCRRGFNMRTMGRCGCRRVKDHEEHQSVVGTDSPPFDRHHT